MYAGMSATQLTLLPVHGTSPEAVYAQSSKALLLRPSTATSTPGKEPKPRPLRVQKVFTSSKRSRLSYKSDPTILVLHLVTKFTDDYKQQMPDWGTYQVL